MANDTARPAPPPLPPMGMPGGPGRGGPASRFTGKVERANDARGALKRLWGYLSRQRTTLIIVALMVMCTAGLDLLGPYLMGRALDGYIVKHDLPGLKRILLLMVMLYISSSVMNFLPAFLMAGAAQRTVRILRNDLFAAFQRLPLPFFDQRPHGDLMSRLTNDVENVNQVLSSSVAQLISGALTMCGIVIAMFLLNPILALVSLTTSAFLFFIVNRVIGQRTRENFRRQQAALGMLNGFIEETVTGQKVVKAYGQEAATMAQFDGTNKELRQSATRAQAVAGIVGPMMNATNNLALAVVVGVGGGLAVRGLATVGTIAMFISYARQFGRPLNDIANLYNTIQTALAGAERVFEVLDETPETDTEPAQPLPAIRGEVVFDDVTFSYQPGTPILKHMSLHALPGQTIALIGPTGAGKTTIINLLTRFYEIDSGRITIDGRDIREIPRSALRRQLGIVLQDTVLFAGTVRDNIRYGRLEATDEEIHAAARLANADTFIQRLPDGYNTLLVERGSNLSQGQRQLLAIARAILADPRILILDEATSSIDTRTEKIIQEAMLRLMAGRTSFVIAHRLSTIQNADQILVINRGEIIERGTHEELLAKKGFYYQLYTSNFETTVD
ncbi:MAG: ABC transporter ATP-binding protein [Armatimonas sp.]